MFNSNEFFNEQMAEHLAVARKTQELLGPDFISMLDLWEQVLRDGGKLLLFGNGGSAADAQHIATELVVRFKSDRPAFAAIALTTDTSALTAAGNDLGFERVFARQIEALGRCGDLAIGFSTSGNSENIVFALAQARKQGLATAGFTGDRKGAIVSVSDVVLEVPSSITAHIQEMHITLAHLLCGGLEYRLGVAELSPQNWKKTT